MLELIKIIKVRSECYNYTVVLKIKHYSGTFERMSVAEMWL